jgi:NDP-sugar pyrophosphorylase family protein
MHTPPAFYPPLPKAVMPPAVLMCGGLGTRLRPWSYVIPKPMFPIGEKPILELLLGRLQRYQITEIYLSLGYKAELIESYFKDGKHLGVNLHYLREPEPLGTAGALGLLRAQLNRPFLMMNGDLVTRLNFQAFYQAHQKQNAAITVGVKAYPIAVPYGVVDAEDNVISRLVEKPTLTVNINAGIYLINPAMLGLLPSTGRYDAPQLIQAAMDARHRVCQYPISEYWMDIGRFEDYDRANSDAQTWVDEDP